MKIKNRKSILVNIDTASYTNNTVTVSINSIPFKVDDVILRNVSVINTDATPEFFVISTNLINEQFLTSIAVPSSSAVNLQSSQRFTLNKTITGNYSFTLLDSNRTITALNNMAIGISLEFVEYHKE